MLRYRINMESPESSQTLTISNFEMGNQEMQKWDMEYRTFSRPCHIESWNCHRLESCADCMHIAEDNVRMGTCRYHLG